MYLQSNHVLMLKNLLKVTYHWAPYPIFDGKKTSVKNVSVKNVASLANRGFSNKYYKKR